MKFTLIIFAAVVLYLVQVATLCTFWRWYVMPVFSVRPLTFLQAMGLLLILSVARPHPPLKKSDDDAMTEAIGYAFGSLCFVWAIAGVIHLFS